MSTLPFFTSVMFWREREGKAPHYHLLSEGERKESRTILPIITQRIREKKKKGADAYQER